MNRTWQYYSIAFIVTILFFTSFEIVSGLEERAAPDPGTETYEMETTSNTASTPVQPEKAAAGFMPKPQENFKNQPKKRTVVKAVAKKEPVKPRKNRVKEKLTLQAHQTSEIAHKLVDLGLAKIGKPYVWGGASEDGFDCSGFVTYVYGRFDIDVPHSSSMLATTGIAVPRTQAKPGDILIFTGTDASQRSPGHVGIVISKPGENLKFVHASSVGGVKISQVEDTNYEKRFLEVRRVL
ncbi:MAG TPA: C40 family peptidase [Adhaeribacter sp.]|nr:C40 family peptidase [Adhaeribacter sp.]